MFGGKAIWVLALFVALIFVLRGCIGKQATETLVKELTAKVDSLSRIDTLSRVDTVFFTVEKWKRVPVRVFLPGDTVTDHTAIDSILQLLVERDSLQFVLDSFATEDLTLIYNLWLNGRLSAAAFTYRLAPHPVVKEYLTTQITVPDNAWHLYAGGFSERKLGQYGPAVLFTKERLALGAGLDLTSGKVIYNLQYRLK